jgi:uncharacterized damage-inducible protein DinB
MLNPMRSGRPGPGEFAEYAATDIAYVQGDDALKALASQSNDVIAMLSHLTDDDVAGRTYATDKWTLKEVLGHLVDDERIFAYRMLCLSRGEPRELPGFDEKLYVRKAHFEEEALESLLGAYRATRAATLAFLASLSDEEWQRRGMVNGYQASVRGLAFHVAGHELRHVRSLQTLYGVRGAD